MMFFYFHSGFKNGYAYKTFRDLKHGYIQEATSSLAYVYNELDKNRNSSAVELSIKPFNTSSIYLPEISKNPNTGLIYVTQGILVQSLVR